MSVIYQCALLQIWMKRRPVAMSGGGRVEVGENGSNQI